MGADVALAAALATAPLATAALAATFPASTLSTASVAATPFATADAAAVSVDDYPADRQTYPGHSRHGRYTRAQGRGGPPTGSVQRAAALGTLG